MPQMAPLLWTNLFIFFTLLVVLTLILNFFVSPPLKITFSKISHKYNKPLWKW